MVVDEVVLFFKQVIRNLGFFDLSLCHSAILRLLDLILMFLPNCPKVVAKTSDVMPSLKK